MEEPSVCSHVANKLLASYFSGKSNKQYVGKCSVKQLFFIPEIPFIFLRNTNTKQKKSPARSIF